MVLLAVLQCDAPHADPLAVLKVNQLLIGEQSEMVIPPVGHRYSSSLGAGCAVQILQEHEQSTWLVWPCRHTQHPALGCAIGYLLLAQEKMIITTASTLGQMNDEMSRRRI